MKEDLGEWVFKDGKEPTEEEMEFHYFKYMCLNKMEFYNYNYNKCKMFRMHDFDNNSKLDGLEIFQAISHIIPMVEVPSEPADASNPEEVLKRAEMVKQREEDFSYYI